VQACVDFYQIIEADWAWSILLRTVPKSSILRKVPRELFDAFLAIAARDGVKNYRILPEKEFYTDGNADLYIVDEMSRV